MTFTMSIGFQFYKRRFRQYGPLIIVMFIFFMGIFYLSASPDLQHPSFRKHLALNNAINKDILKLERKVKLLESTLKKHNIPESEYMEGLLPVIYVITPTHARPQQKAELTRLKNVFLHVPALHWILVEDSEQKTGLVKHFLESGGISFTHLNVPTPKDWKLGENQPVWQKPRGVLQRNAGLDWLRSNFEPPASRAVVYFADDDNTYSTELFQEMRWTKKVSVWPVALVGGVMVERPKVTLSGKVNGWLTGWKPDRAFATDMAGFGINLDLLVNNPEAEFSLDSQKGFMESDFLEKIVKLHELEPKADMCTKVYIWHTRTEKPNMKDEEKLRKEGRPTNRNIEV
ncbi:unnamed protein product [Meganyctiphanes norvegica]|uniref:Galactosylgalactosylxylosylprotein 3-beta-glucuronosyltransferase n=1 Tax=Meganyctiphanes norvegica TaxID=48144 RepID=A0AAV2PLE7_MEGNR